MISLRNVVKRYNGFSAVDNISLDALPGEIFAFLGVNGAGKTTTIKMAVGILKPTSGSITIGGYNALEEPEKAKGIIGYIPDRPYIYPKLTGREFLYFVADLHRIKKIECEEKIDQLLSDYSLLEWQDELVESYSHGMKQRLATCSALIHSPKALIIDEPMVGLDPHGARTLKKALKNYAERGMAIFLSTHSLNVAEELADRLAIIHKGAILFQGTLSELKQSAGKQDEKLEDIFIQLTTQQENLNQII